MIQEAETLLNQLDQCTVQNEIVSAIQGEARELRKSILIGVYVTRGDLKGAKRHLASMLAKDPRDTSLLASFHRIEMTEYLSESAEQVKAIQQEIADNQRRRQDDLNTYSQAARNEARWWYLASLLSAAVSFGVFVYAIFFLIGTNQALSYLTPLYTLLPGLLSALFFNQYAQANRRVDEARDRVWHRAEEFERQNTNDIKTIYDKMLETVESSGREIQDSITYGKNTSVIEDREGPRQATPAQ
jgi:ABC-type multidrug transport system fused ATPase/permease subunit